MLKRNLIIVPVFCLMLIPASSAFAQWHPEIDRVRSKKSISKTKIKAQSIKSPRDAASGQSSGKIKKPASKSYNLGDTATHEIGYRRKSRTTRQIRKSIKERN